MCTSPGPSSTPPWLPLHKSSAPRMRQCHLVYQPSSWQPPCPRATPHSWRQTSLTALALGHFPTQGPTMALSAWLIKFKFPNLASGLLSLIWPLFPHLLPPPLICILCSSLPTTMAPGFPPPFPHPGSSHQHPSQGQRNKMARPLVPPARALDLLRPPSLVFCFSPLLFSPAAFWKARPPSFFLSICSSLNLDWKQEAGLPTSAAQSDGCLLGPQGYLWSEPLSPGTSSLPQ